MRRPRHRRKLYLADDNPQNQIDQSVLEQLVSSYHNNQSLQVLSNTISISGVVSGNALAVNILLVLVDVYGQVVTTADDDNSTIVTIQSMNTADSSLYDLDVRSETTSITNGIITIGQMITEYYLDKNASLKIEASLH